MKKSVYIILSCFFFLNLFSKKKTNLDSLKKLGRDSLIKLAAIKIGEGFDPVQYDRIIVKASSKALIVEFRLSVILHDGNDCYYSHVTIALAGSGSTGMGIQGDCENPKFYKHTKARKSKIDFVFNAINKSDEVGHMADKKVSPGNTMEITEKLTYYQVEVDDWSTHSQYRVDKITGKIYDASHKHYARDHEEKDEFEVIK